SQPPPPELYTLSLHDALPILALLPHANFVVKAAMARNPVTACLVSMAGYIPNDFEGSDLINRSVEALQDGQSLVIFPEGTRTARSEEHTSELQSRENLVCRLL